MRLSAWCYHAIELRAVGQVWIELGGWMHVSVIALTLSCIAGTDLRPQNT